jgi:hypothetical protein
MDPLETDGGLKIADPGTEDSEYAVVAPLEQLLTVRLEEDLILYTEK